MEKNLNKPLVRFNTRIREDQQSYIKSEVKKSKGALTEGQLTRTLLDEAITNRKSK